MTTDFFEEDEPVDKVLTAFESGEKGFTGGWCAPTACGTGTCTTEPQHDPGCPGPGWAYRVVAHADGWMNPVDMSTLAVRRGE